MVVKIEAKQSGKASEDKGKFQGPARAGEHVPKTVAESLARQFHPESGERQNQIATEVQKSVDADKDKHHHR